MELDLAGYGESHPEVKLYCAMVLGADMEPGDQALAAMISRKMPDKACSVAFAAMCWVRADATDLGVAVARTAAEETREREVGECAISCAFALESQMMPGIELGGVISAGSTIWRHSRFPMQESSGTEG
jgi:hypothetical protein